MAAIVSKAIASVSRISTFGQLLLYLPLTLSTLSKPAFLVLSLLLTIHSIIHCTLAFFIPPDSSLFEAIDLGAILSLLQVPVHPILLLLAFNIFSPTSAILSSNAFSAINTLAGYWGTALRYSGPLFAGMEGLASLIVIQTWGLVGKDLAARSEAWQFSLLIGASSVYVASASWLYIAYPSVASTPLSSTLFGIALTALVFLTLIGFGLRRTNVIESSGIALFLAYNIWLCSDDTYPLASWPDLSASYTPLLQNIFPHLQTLLTFFTHTVPKPLLAALLYRLSILHLASRIIPRIGGDGWENEVGVGGGWEARPTSKLTSVILAYRQTILITVYSHLLLLDHSSQVWWRWTSVFFTLAMWSLELLVTGGEDEDEGIVASLKDWKVE